jgi:hypothetical protein
MESNNNLLYPPENDANETSYDTDDEYYKISVGRFMFQVVATRKGERYTYEALDADGIACINIVINLSDPESELLLSGLSFRESCTIGYPMTRGEGTVAMIKALLIFVMHKHPTIDRVTLTDDSKFDCVLPDGSRVPIHLGIHNLLLYGKTWYQRIFGATPIDDSTKRNTNIILQKLNSPLPDNFNVFWNIRTGNYFDAKHEWIHVMKQEMQALFSDMKSKTCMEYLRAVFARDSILSKKYGDNIPCAIYYLLQQHLETQFSVSNIWMSQWEISRDVIENYPEYHTSSIEPNHMPERMKHRANYSLGRLNYLQDAPYFSVGGKQTRRLKYNKPVYVPSGYGALTNFSWVKRKVKKTQRNWKRMRKGATRRSKPFYTFFHLKRRCKR